MKERVRGEVRLMDLGSDDCGGGDGEVVWGGGGAGGGGEFVL